MKDKINPAIVLSGVCVLMVVLFVAAAEPDWEAIRWGDAPTWFAGLIALAAAFFAWRAGRTALELLAVERRREDRADDERRARELADQQAFQADQVAAWIDDYAGNRIYVHNGSALPIFDVRLELHNRMGLFQAIKAIEVIRPVTTLPTDDVGHLRKGLVNLPGRPSDLPPLPEGVPPRVGLAFRDCSGRVWHRDTTGVLHKATAETNSFGWPIFPTDSE